MYGCPRSNTGIYKNKNKNYCVKNKNKDRIIGSFKTLLAKCQRMVKE